jgi:hypothetical protein
MSNSWQQPAERKEAYIADKPEAGLNQSVDDEKMLQAGERDKEKKQNLSLPTDDILVGAIKSFTERFLIAQAAQQVYNQLTLKFAGRSLIFAIDYDDKTYRFTVRRCVNDYDRPISEEAIEQIRKKLQDQFDLL